MQWTVKERWNIPTIAAIKRATRISESHGRKPSDQLLLLRAREKTMATILRKAYEMVDALYTQAMRAKRQADAYAREWDLE